jgi:shikimate dehydrogenase
LSLATESFLIGLIGSGITGSLTPLLHEREADEQGLRLLYRPIDLDVIGRPGEDVGDLLRAARGLGFTDFNITYPSKQLVLEHLDELTDDARKLGAVNTVLIRDGRLIGHNTDHSGFSWGLANGLPDASLDEVVQLGTGGAGAAVAYALLDSGVGRLGLFDVDRSRAEERADALRALFPDRRIDAIESSVLPTALRTATGLVNATPVGMHHHPGLPLPADLVTERLWVADVVYRPIETALLRLATERGCRVLDGGNMTVGQAIECFELFTGRKADSERMRAHFLELIATGR